jgi:formate hydrogenlyase subunit 6/NADH:ubiquinone oxidoreductase subunit I
MSQPNTHLALPQIDLARCTGCSRCVQLCPTAAVTVIDGHAAIIRPEACTFCEVCESYCPTGAIGRPFSVVFAADQRGATKPSTDSSERNER